MGKWQIQHIPKVCKMCGDDFVARNDRQKHCVVRAGHRRRKVAGIGNLGGV